MNWWAFGIGFAIAFFIVGLIIRWIDKRGGQ